MAAHQSPAGGAVSRNSSDASGKRTTKNPSQPGVNKQTDARPKAALAADFFQNWKTKAFDIDDTETSDKEEFIEQRKKRLKIELLQLGAQNLLQAAEEAAHDIATRKESSVHTTHDDFQADIKTATANHHGSRSTLADSPSMNKSSGDSVSLAHQQIQCSLHTLPPSKTSSIADVSRQDTLNPANGFQAPTDIKRRIATSIPKNDQSADSASMAASRYSHSHDQESLRSMPIQQKPTAADNGSLRSFATASSLAGTEHFRREKELEEDWDDLLKTGLPSKKHASALTKVDKTNLLTVSANDFDSLSGSSSMYASNIQHPKSIPQMEQPRSVSQMYAPSNGSTVVIDMADQRGEAGGEGAFSDSFFDEGRIKGEQNNFLPDNSYMSGESSKDNAPETVVQETLSPKPPSIAEPKERLSLFVKNVPERASMHSYASSATFPEHEHHARQQEEMELDEMLKSSRNESVLLSSMPEEQQHERTEQSDNLDLDLDSDLDSTESESEYAAWKKKQATKLAVRREEEKQREDERKRRKNQRKRSKKASDAVAVNIELEDTDHDANFGTLYNLATAANVAKRILRRDSDTTTTDEDDINRTAELDNNEQTPDFLEVDTRPKTLEEQEMHMAFDGLINLEKKLQEKATEKKQRMRDTSYYFDDGKRVIDFVLAFQPKLQLKDQNVLRKEVLHRKYRKAFEDKLQDLGLELEHEGIEKSQDGKTCFTKIHATWEFLCMQAELQQIKVPLAPIDIKKPAKTGVYETAMTRCCNGNNPFRLPEYVLPEVHMSYRARFDNKRKSMFSIENMDTFFTPTQRIRMVYDTVQRLTVKLPLTRKQKLQQEQQQKKKGIKLSTKGYENESQSFFSLMEMKTYSAAYPIHDSDYRYPVKENPFYNVDANVLPERFWLYTFWGSYGSWRNYQPLDHITEYFGVRVGLYFAWLGFYTRWLYIPSIVGLVCFIFGVISMQYDGMVREFCDGNGWGNKTMCRLCPTVSCPYTKLITSCGYAQISHVFDNYSTVVFTLFLSIWSIAFLEAWKRRQSELTAHWGSADREFNDVVVRAQYQLTVTTTHLNPVTQVEEPYVPETTLARHVISSGAAVAFFILIVLSFMVGLIMYRILSVAVYTNLHNAFIDEVSPNMVTSVTTSVANAVVIFIMTLLYRRAAWWLTEYEFPRTDEEFEVSYTYKVFLFQFMNYYGSLFYLALFKGKFQGDMNDLDKFSDQCGYSGCMAEVCIQLIIIMSGKQILNNVVEVCMPILHNYFRMRNLQKETEDNEFSRWERDFVLNANPVPGQFADYLEMIIQYGFLVMFAPAFPLAAVFALLNNVLEIRIDANKMLTEYRRPIPERVPNIGAWFSILEILTKLAVIVNAAVISFTSDFIDRLVYDIFYRQSGVNPTDGYMNYMFTTFDPQRYLNLTYPNTAEAMLLLSNSEGTNITECWYKGYYGRANTAEEYQRTLTWWHVICARLGFVIVFEHVVMMVQYIIQNVVADVPEHVTLKMEREKYITKQLFMKNALGDEKFNEIYDKEPEESQNTVAIQPPIPDQDGHGRTGTLSVFRRSVSNKKASDVGVGTNPAGRAPSKKQSMCFPLKRLGLHAGYSGFCSIL